MVTSISDYFLYRWRYLLGYGVIVILMAALLAVTWFLIPGGISSAEMNSTVNSSSLTFSIQTFKPEAIVNLPYHLLQHGSFTLFGVSDFSIKLPSIALGLLSALGILLLLRMWFKQNVAVITTVLVLTTGQFLFITQDGTPTVVYIFWSVWLLVSALMVSRRVGGWPILWKVALFGISALSLYTPLAVYIILALLSAAALHPHLRYIIRHLSKVRLLIGFACGLILLAPLIYTIIKEPAVGLQLLGIPTTMPNILDNGRMLFDQYLTFMNPGGLVLLTPVYGLGAVILMTLGIVRLFTMKYTARGYITIAWIILLLPAIIINPRYVTVAFLPIILLTAMGVSMLITMWYQLFPRNPYARIAGLIPLAVLIGGMLFSGVERYIYTYQYNPSVATQFSQDLQLLNTFLSENAKSKVTVLVSDREVPFYAAVAKYSDQLTVVAKGSPLVASDFNLVSKSAKEPKAGNPTTILTNSKKDNADRFYIYKSS